MVFSPYLSQIRAKRFFFFYFLPGDIPMGLSRGVNRQCPNLGEEDAALAAEKGKLSASNTGRGHGDRQGCGSSALLNLSASSFPCLLLSSMCWEHGLSKRADPKTRSPSTAWVFVLVILALWWAGGSLQELLS